MAEFKRKIFYVIKDFIEHSQYNICFLYGPRKVGKTTCLKQLHAEYPNSKLFNFKEIATEEKREEAYYAIEDCIGAGTNQVCLVDEVSYLDEFDCWLRELGDRVCTDLSMKCKLVVTGSQSVYLRSLAGIHFGHLCKEVSTSFLEFDEYCKWRYHIPYHADLSLITEEMFREFLEGSHEFSKIEDVETYIDMYLKENAKSMERAQEYAEIAKFHSYADEIMQVLIAALYKLSDFAKVSKVSEGYKQLKEPLRAYNREHRDSKIALDTFFDALKSKAYAEYCRLSDISFDKLVEIIRFLIENGLICWIVRSKRELDEVRDRIYYHRGPVCNKEMLFENKTVFVKYPFFLVSILNDISKDLGVESLIFNSLYGKIVECYIRGLCCSRSHRTYSIEFHVDRSEDMLGAEVDIIDDDTDQLIEISVKDKPVKDTHFDRVPNHELYAKVLLGKTSSGMRVAYYTMAYILADSVNSIPKEYLGTVKK